VTLRRGFLAESEREAKRIRAELGLGPGEPVDVSQIAKHLGIRVIAADELIDAARLHDLERVQAFAFSACTFDIDGTKVIVVNPLRTPARRASDIAHELAHLLLAHQLDEIRSVGGVPFRTCRPDQEEEATNLGGTLLLPRPLLLSAVRRGLDDQAIAAQYDVTTEMARFRVNRTGVRRQLRSTRQRRDTGAST
jgi:Zn-dependent peptidase ImmA (M78 family)